MEVDSGTFVTVMSQKIKSELFGKLKVEKTTAYLRGYDGKKLQPIGKLENLTENFKNKERKLHCFILPGSGPALIGRQWLAAFGYWPLSFLKTDTVRQTINKLNFDINAYIMNEYRELFGPTPGLYNKVR